MKELVHKKVFLNEIKNKINTGQWGLSEVQYLEDHHVKYHLNYDDIGGFLKNAFDYVYNLVYEDGQISQLESSDLAYLNQLSYQAQNPVNKAQREDLKIRIRSLIKICEKHNLIEDDLLLERQNKAKKENTLMSAENLKPTLDLKPEQVDEKEKEHEIKNNVKSIYYMPAWYRRPKLTPYQSYY